MPVIAVLETEALDPRQPGTTTNMAGKIDTEKKVDM